jgi:hypothetical protein
MPSPASCSTRSKAPARLQIGIRGNTHFPFSDLNNVQIADLMSAFLTAKHLD